MTQGARSGSPGATEPRGPAGFRRDFKQLTRSTRRFLRTGLAGREGEANASSRSVVCAVFQIDHGRL